MPSSVFPRESAACWQVLYNYFQPAWIFFPLFNSSHNDKSELQYKMYFAGKWLWWIWCHAAYLLDFRAEELYLIVGVEEKSHSVQAGGCCIVNLLAVVEKKICILLLFFIFFRPDTSMSYGVSYCNKSHVENLSPRRVVCSSAPQLRLLTLARVQIIIKSNR